MKISGERQLALVKKFDYIREAGTPGEAAAADQLLEEIRLLGVEGRREAFSFETERIQKEGLEIFIPDRRSCPIRGILRAKSTPEEGIIAPIVYAEDVKELSEETARGALILLSSVPTEEEYHILETVGIAGILVVCGSPLDAETDRRPPQLRLGPWANASLPAAAIHYVDAAALAEEAEEQEVRARLCVRHEKTTVESANVIARIEGTEHPEEILTLSAHYDSVPDGPGAYDNMAGAAMVMEALRYFQAHPPQRTLEFLWFGGEEKGLKGSRAYVAAHQEELASHVLNLNIDLAGQALGVNVLGVTASKETAEALVHMANERGLFPRMKNQVWASDSNTFAWKGIPALTINRDGYGMHTWRDRAEYLSPRALKKGTELLIALAEAVSKRGRKALPGKVPEEMRQMLDAYFAGK